MDTDLTAREIKDIRTRYGLSQQAFARVLGLGEASIVRYENGQKPTRANANLIRAAKNPSFMRDCLERDGNRISPMQRDRAEQIIYAEVTFNEKGDVMDINELYSLTLQQEILNEKAAEMLGDLSRTVSYTHLDVYKRQRAKLPCATCSTKRGMGTPTGQPPTHGVSGHWMQRRASSTASSSE